MAINKLLLLKGEPYKITNLVSVNNPTLGQITDFGEERYFQLLTHLCATSFDYRLMLFEAGIDWVEVDDWTMFWNMQLSFEYEETQIIIPNIDISKLQLYKDENNGEIVMMNDEGEIVINAAVYYEMVEFIRNCHNFERNFKIPGNKMAREIYMREAREARQFAGSRPFKSYLEPLVSALCNSEGFKYNFDTVWDLPIYAFMDATRRIQKIKSADHLLGGMYSGMLDTSKMNKGTLNKELNWMGELK